MRRTIVTSLCLLFLASSTAGAAIEGSDSCGSCHRDIYRMWRSSAHAEATEDPFFYETLREVRDTGGNAKARVCLDCHAPLAVEAKDLDLRLRISREGVGCEYCHGLVRVEMTEKGPRHELEIGNVKRGTIAEADSPAHGVAYSQLHTDSLVCAPCHEFVSASGTAVLTTYSEWRDSRAAEEGRMCQSCHMAITEASVVDPKVQRKSNARVNLHAMPGGHSLQQLHEALDVKFRPYRDEDEVLVDVVVTNEGAGHSVPTGMPGRRILLVVQVNAGPAGTFEAERTYAKTFRNASGKRIDHVAGYFEPGVTLEADTRIGPDETRTESFRFPIPPEAAASVTVKMHYEHAPRGEDEEKVWMTFLSERQLLRAVRE